MPKRIDIIMLGGMHSDPTISELNFKWSQKCRAQKIPIVVCLEQPRDAFNGTMGDAPERQESIVTAIKGMQRHPKTKNAINAILDKCLKYPFFPLQKRQELDAFYKKYAIEKMCRIPLEVLQKYANIQASLAYYQWLKESNIPVFGLNLNQRSMASLHRYTTPLITAGYNTEGVMAIFEKLRVEAMLHQLLSNALPQIQETGGVIFFNDFGGAHIHRLAAYLHLGLQKSPLIDTEVHLHPILSDSPYCTLNPPPEFGVPYVNTLAPLRVIDPPNIRAYYDSHPCHVIRPEVTKHKTKAPSFDAYMSDVLSKQVAANLSAEHQHRFFTQNKPSTDEKPRLEIVEIPAELTPEYDENYNVNGFAGLARLLKQSKQIGGAPTAPLEPRRP